MRISENIKYLRKLYGVSGQELADKLGVKRSTLSGYETGAREPTISTLLQMCDIFNVNAHQLLVEDLSDLDQVGIMADRIASERPETNVSDAGMWDYRNLVKEVEDMKKKLDSFKTT